MEHGAQMGAWSRRRVQDPVVRHLSIFPGGSENMCSSFLATIVEHIKPIEGSLPITCSSPLFSLSEVLVAVCSLLLG